MLSRGANDRVRVVAHRRLLDLDAGLEVDRVESHNRQRIRPAIEDPWPTPRSVDEQHRAWWVLVLMLRHEDEGSNAQQRAFQHR